MICPKRLKMAIMIKATTTALAATLLRILGSASPTMVRKTGVLPTGFSMAKKPMNTVVRNNVRSGIEFIMAQI
jgi:hypothetical protein